MNSLDYPSAPHSRATLAALRATLAVLRAPRSTAALVLGCVRLPLLMGALGATLMRPLAARAAPPALHDVHLTYSRVVVDGASVIFRVRLFHDDLERALQQHARNPALKVVPGAAAADTAFASYFNANVPVSANGRHLVARVVQSGKDMDVTDQEMWWYLVELTAPAPVTSLSMRVGLLFEHFTDQRNIVTLLRTPGEKRYSMYFVREDAKEQVVF